MSARSMSRRIDRLGADASNGSFLDDLDFSAGAAVGAGWLSANRRHA